MRVCSQGTCYFSTSTGRSKNGNTYSTGGSIGSTKAEASSSQMCRPFISSIEAKEKGLAYPNSSNMPSDRCVSFRSFRYPLVGFNGRFIDPDETRAEQFWTSPRLRVSNTSHADQWRFELTLNRIRDFIDPSTNRPWTDDVMRLFNG